jgi:hypothetical protein
VRACQAPLGQQWFYDASASGWELVIHPVVFVWLVSAWWVLSVMHYQGFGYY